MRRSVLAALVLSLGLTLWLASRPIERWLGLSRHDSAPIDARSDAEPAHPPFTVAVRISRAQTVAPELVLSGVTEPARAVVLRAEVAGRVVETPKPQGAFAEEGEALLRLDPRERPERVRELEARLAQRELEYEAARRLGARGFQAETRVAEARAALEEVRARLAEARAELERTVIRAPFPGRLERRTVEVGDFLEVGREIGVFVATRPMLVVARVPETRIGALAPGMVGSARLADGRVVEGVVRFVARRSEDQTRTFRVEFEVTEPSEDIPAGVTARLVIQLPPVAAHRLPASVLILDDAGRIGVRFVDERDRVRFAAVTIVRAQGGTVWLAGLPEVARVITLGQGFVSEGQEVRVHLHPEREDEPAA